MGVDFYTCQNCGETYPDCGPTAGCEKGHYLGPCCFPNHAHYWPEEQENEDGEVLEEFCPVCQDGGSTEEKLKKAEKDLKQALKESARDQRNAAKSQAEAAKLLDENNRLREALRFYANRGYWVPIPTGIGDMPGPANDYGATARQALNPKETPNG